MTRGDHGAEFAHRLAQLRERSATTPATRTTGSPTASGGTGTGESADGAARVTVANGTVESVRLTPEALRSASFLERAVTSAANAALAAATGIPGAPSPTVDADALATQVAAVEQQALRTFAAISAGLDEVIRRVGDRSGMRGDPAAPGLSELFAATRRELLSLRGSAADAVTGEGWDPDGEVLAVVRRSRGTERVERIEIDPRALGRGSVRAGEQLRAALDTALGRVRQTEEATGPHRADDPAAGSAEQTSGPARRVRELQDFGIDVMQDQVGRLSGIMASIGDPDGAEHEGGDPDER